MNTVCLLLLALQTQAPSERVPEPPRRLHAEVNVRLRQQIEEERRIPEYRQREPVDHPLEFASGRGRFSGRFRFESECEAPPPGGEQAGLPPQDPGDGLKVRRDEWPPPPPPPPPPWDPWDFWNPGDPATLQFTGLNPRTSTTSMTVTGRISKLQFNVALTSSTVSDLRTDPATSGTGAATTPTPPAGGGGGVVTPPPAPTPTNAAPAASSSASASETGTRRDEEDSDAPFLAGPELSIPLADDLSRWKPLAWTPAGTSLGFAARALFGTIEVFETRSDAELYGVGLGLRVPLLRGYGFQAEAGFFAGPGYLHTDFGDAWGFSGSAGLRLSLGLGKGCAVVAAAEAEWFEGDGVSAWGPSVNLGLNIGW